MSVSPDPNHAFPVSNMSDVMLNSGVSNITSNVQDHAHDTGYFYEEVFEYLKEQKIVSDIISFDCTHGNNPTSDEGSHMRLDNIFRVVDRLRENGNVDQHTTLVINLFSHNANPLHEVLEEQVCKKGYLVSYDGMCIEI